MSSLPSGRRSFTSTAVGVLQLASLIIPLIKWWNGRKLPDDAIITDQQRARDVKRQSRSTVAKPRKSGR